MNYLGSFLEWFSRTFDVEFDKPFTVLSHDRPLGAYVLKSNGIFEADNIGVSMTSYFLKQILSGEIEVISNWKPKEGEIVVYAGMFKGNIELSKGSFRYNDSKDLLMLALGLIFKDTPHLSNSEIVKKAEEIYKTLQRDLKGE